MGIIEEAKKEIEIFDRASAATSKALIEEVERLRLALKDAELFSSWVECLGRTDCEIYKHELKASADLSIERIQRALEV